LNADGPFLVAVLAANVAASEWLVVNTRLRHLGSALLVILLTAVEANLGLIPTYSDDVPVYAGIFTHVAPLAIFLLLLRVDLRGLSRAGLPMIGAFALGTVGTLAGVAAGIALVGGEASFGPLHWALGGMFAGTYTGGGVNFNAVAIEYDVIRDGALYAGAAAVDNAMTMLWMVVTVVLPRILTRRHSVPVPRASGAPEPAAVPTTDDDAASDRESVAPFDVALLVAGGLLASRVSDLVAAWTGVPSVLILTTLALAVAQLPLARRLRGARMTGWLAVLLFLAVIGALCDVDALARIGPLAARLGAFVTILVSVHGLLVFGVGALLKVDPALSAVASQANIGGSTSALALARSLGREDLALPGVLVGALGNAVGTYLGFLVAAWLR
jgi:uncharacterized membrane protein